MESTRKRVHGVTEKGSSISDRGSVFMESVRKPVHGIIEEARSWSRKGSVFMESPRKHNWSTTGIPPPPPDHFPDSAIEEGLLVSGR